MKLSLPYPAPILEWGTFVALCGAQMCGCIRFATPASPWQSKGNMSRLVAGLLAVTLVGVTSLALACDFRCRLEDSLVADASSPCHPHESHPAAPQHAVHTKAVVKALGVLAVPDAASQTLSNILKLHEMVIAATSEPLCLVPAVFVLRI